MHVDDLDISPGKIGESAQRIIDRAIEEAKAETQRPSLIICRTHIGFGSPNKHDTAEAHGAPLRLVLPHLYFWKSPKWLARIEFRTGDRQGYWETRGYHNRGDPWAEERYSAD